MLPIIEQRERDMYEFQITSNRAAAITHLALWGVVIVLHCFGLI